MAGRMGGSALDRYWAELTSSDDDDGAEAGAQAIQREDEENRETDAIEQDKQRHGLEEQKRKKKKPFRYLDLPQVVSSDDDGGDEAGEGHVPETETDETRDWFSGLRQRQARKEQEEREKQANTSEAEQTERSIELVEEHTTAGGHERRDESGSRSGSGSDSDSDSGEEGAAGGPGAGEEKRKRRKEERRKRKRQHLLLRRLETSNDAKEGEEGKSPELPEGNEGGVRPSKNKRRKLQKKRRMQELKKKATHERQPPMASAAPAADASSFIYVPQSGIEVRAAKQEEALLVEACDDDDDGEGLVDIGSCGIDPIETTRSAYHAFVEHMHAQRGTGTKEEEVRQFFEGVVGLMTRHVRSGGHHSLHSGEDVVKLVHDTEIGCSRLFQLLRSRRLPRQVVMNLWEIKSHLMKGQYRDANEKYFSLTIGNAPWPTTEPTLRAETMELLQTVKRLMTFCEEQR